MHSQFRRVAIVNRGEPAMRFIHAVREFNLEHRADLLVIALFTEPDRHARFVREADESYDLGPSTFVDGRDGLRRPTYLDYAALERALTAVHAEAVWAGWGFVGERPEFAEMCERLGIAFIGPDSGAMRRLGDKINAKRFAEQAGIPVVPWGGGPADTRRGGRARRPSGSGIPCCSRRAAAPAAAASGGWSRPSRSRRRSAAVRRDAARIFNDTTVFVERYLPGMRHIEVQIQADALRHGLGGRHPGLLDAAAPAETGLRGARRPGCAPESRRRCSTPPSGWSRRRSTATRSSVEFLVDPARPLLVPRGQHPPAGRARGHRTDQRPGPGEARTGRGARGEAGGRRRRPAPGTPSKCA